MFIERIIIEGFKSYAHREVLDNFDPNFVAITGLNGSGKSNVFDALIFVLGGTNWAQMRVQNPQNLVYKAGQAGIHKASVTIVFNNDDKDNSPAGYEKAPQITVTRQVIIRGHDTISKFLINGVTSTLKKVKQLFRSVQLNVKNPHFLIMQGRITKVLNMKPPEVLGMIEEAAGTKMYDEKREEAMKEIERKQKKVEEINRILKDEITPTLTHLDRQQKQYIAYQEAKRDFERLDKFRIAHHYTSASHTLKAAENDVKDLKEKIAGFQRQKSEHGALIKSIEAQIAELVAKKEEAFTDDFKAFAKEVSDLDTRITKQETSKGMQEAAKKETEQEIEKLKQSLHKLQQSLTSGAKGLEAAKEQLKAAEQERDKRREFLESLLVQKQAIQSGVAADQGKSLSDILMQLDAEEKEAQSEVTLAQKRSAAAKKELAAAQKEAKKSDSSFAALQTEAAALDKELAEAKKNVDKGDFSEQTFAGLQEQRQTAFARVKELKANVEKFRAEVGPRRAFNYTQPDGFDKTKVFGRVLDLFEVSDGKYSQALDVVAGGRLFDVVVENEAVSKALLEKGKLKSRTTFIPLNKIQSQDLSKDQIAMAIKICGKDKVWPAQSLVRYNARDEAAMKYVFGRTFICATSDVAKQVCFHESIKARCVTLEGDLFDPAGTLTGGSAPQQGSLVVKLTELRTQEKDLDGLSKTLRQVEDEITRLDSIQKEFQKANSELELKTKKREMLTARLAQTDAFQQQKETERLEHQIKEDEAAAEEWKGKREKALQRAKEVQEQIKSFNKEAQLKKTEKDIEAARKDLKKQDDVVAKQRVSENEALGQLRADEEQSKEEQQRLEELAAQVTQLVKTIADEEKKLSKLRKDFDEKSEVVKARKTEAAAADASISKLNSQKEAAERSLEEGKLNVRDWEHRLGTLKEAADKAGRLQQSMLQQYPWIQAEEQFFGRPRGEFDFSARKIEEVNAQLAELEEKQDKLGKQINAKALAMYNQAQKEYTELIEKKSVIEQDRKKIEAFIAQLDEKKLSAITDTFKVVNSEFGTIFSQLLINASAKLQPEDPKDIMSGLRVVVALGGVWKETLSELSGGQKSLLALALVLAMLVYKPAPMYILDEIDAALDLSHTQNIGEVLKNHPKFKKAQFIIISLKEGMFNNANVLFRVQNVNGSSKVTRIESRSVKGKGKREAADEAEAAGEATTSKKARREQPV